MNRTRLSAVVICIAFSLFAQESGLFNGSTPFDWNDSAKITRIYPGFKITFLELHKPRIMKINAAQIDLKNPKLGICVTKADPDAGKPMPDFPAQNITTRRQRTRAFMQEARKPISEGGLGVNMVFASNASAWTPWQTPFTHKYATNLGLHVCNGALVHPATGRSTFIMYKDGTFEMKKTTAKTDISNIQNAISGFDMCLVGGKFLGDKTVLAPRTGFGLAANNDYLIVIAIDGRQKGYSEGCTITEVAEILQYFGAVIGINMDGGGSTSFVIWDAEKKDAVMLNHQGGGWERSVGANIGFYIKD